MTADEKFDLILKRLDAIEAKLTPVPPAIEVPAASGGLYDFVRPSPSNDAYGLGYPMTTPDPTEAVLRACGNVNWRGDVALSPEERDARWEIIERLKKGDPELLPFYKMLDPGFCGLGLLTGAVPPHTADAASFGATKFTREAWAGTTIASFLADNLNLGGTPGIA